MRIPANIQIIVCSVICIFVPTRFICDYLFGRYACRARQSYAWRCGRAGASSSLVKIKNFSLLFWRRLVIILFKFSIQERIKLGPWSRQGGTLRGLFLTQDSEHLGAANRTNARHRAALNATLALHGNFFGVFHFSLGFAFYAICLSHNILIIHKPRIKANKLIHNVR